MATTVAATPKKALRRASVAASAFTEEAFDGAIELLGSDPTTEALKSVRDKDMVDKLVYAKIKKILEDRQAAARENESRAQAAEGGPEA